MRKLASYIISSLFFCFGFYFYAKSATFTSIASDNWGKTTTWSVVGVDADGLPDGDDDVTITGFYNVAMNGNPGTCYSLTIIGIATWANRITNVGAGGVIMDGGTIQATNTGQLNVSGDFTVTGGTATLARIIMTVSGTTYINSTCNITNATGSKTFTHLTVTGTLTNNLVNQPITINGNLTNNGTYNVGTGQVTFGGASSNTITGTSLPDANYTFNSLNINKGTDNSSILDVQSQITLTAGGLTLTNGTLELTNASINITPFTVDITAAPYLIRATAGLWCNGATINAGNMNWSVAGLLRISNGTVNLGTAPDNRFLAVNGGTTQLTIDGGTFNIAGRLSRAAGTDNIAFTMSGGILNVPTIGSTSTTIWPIMIDQVGSSFTMSNGTIIIQQRGGTAVENFGFLATAGSVGITGGVIQFGNGSTPAGQIMRMNTTFSIANLNVNNDGGNTTCQLAVNNLTVLQSITINSGGTLDANNLNITLGNSWTNSGTFTYGTGTVTLNGTGTQTITNTAGEVFNNLTIDKVSGTASLANNVQVRNILTMTQGNIDCGANTLTLGVSTASTGTLTYSAGTIIGNFKRWKDATAGAILFPIGTSSYYRSVLVTFNAVVGGTLTASFLSNPPYDPGSSGLPYLDDDGITLIQNQYTEGYWDLTAADGPLSSTDFNIECTGNGFTSYTIGASTRLMYRPTSGSPWWPPLNGTHSPAIGNTAIRNNVSGLSAQFAFGKPACSSFATASITTLTPDPICTPQLNVDYSVNASNPLNTYAWSLPLGGGTVDPPGTGASVTVDWTGAGGQYSVQVIETNNCGDANSPVTKSVAVHPIATSSITGATTVATNETNVPYSVTNTTGYTYSWTVTGAGNTIDPPASGVNVNAITIDWGTTPSPPTYTVRVDVTPSCGAPDFQTLSVTVRGPILSTATGGNWTLGGTWVGGVAPTSADYVEIVAGAPSIVTINNNSAACYKLTINGNANWNLAKTLTVGNGGVVINGSGNITGAGNGILISTGGLTLNNNSNISSSSVTIRLQTNAQNIITSGVPGWVNILDILTTVTNTGTLKINDGGTLSTSSGSGTLTQAANSTLTMRGSTFSLSILDASATGNTVEYGANAAQTVRAGTYHHLKFSTSGASNTKTLEGIIAVNGDLTITGVTLDASTTNYAVTVSGNWTNTGTYNPRFNTTTFNGGALQTITNAAGETFNNLNMSGAGSKILAGNVTINFDFTLNAPVDIGDNDMDIKGNFDNSGAYTASPLNDVTFSNSSIVSGSSTTQFINVIITGALTGHSFNMSVSGNWANNGTFSHNNGVVTFNGTTTVSGTSTTTFRDVTISGTLTGHSSTTNVAGNWTNNGTYNHNNGTLGFTGTTGQTIGGSVASETYSGLTINNSAGVTLNHTANLLATLTLTSGIFNISGQTFTIISNASGTGRVGTIPGGGGTISGNFAMQRYVSGNDGWRMLGSPVGGSDIEGWNDDFAMSGFTGTDAPGGWVSVYRYNEAATGNKDQGWVIPSSTADAMSAGTGMFTWVGDALGDPITKTLDQNGSLTSGSQVLTVQYTDDPGQPDSEDGWNLFANPYPSDIDWSLVTLSASVTPWAYVWSDAMPGYVSYNAGAGSNSIASHQGFWVKANLGAGTITIDENDKSPQINPFLKLANNTVQTITLRISGSNYSNSTEIRFLDSATMNYDMNYDAFKLFNSGMDPNLFDISSLSNDSVNLSLNSISYQIQSISIRVMLNIGDNISIPANFYISSNLSNYPTGSCVILEDLETGIFTDLHSTDSFSVSVTISQPHIRFVLHIGPPLLMEQITPSCVGYSNGMAIAESQGTPPWNYLWFNMNGDTLRAVENSSSADTLKNIGPGSYILFVSGSNILCNSITDTFLITQSPSVINHFTDMTGVSCNGYNDGMLKMFAFGNNPPFNYNWSNGETTEGISNLFAGSYAVTISDAINCIVNDSFTLANPEPVIAGFILPTDTIYLSQGAMINITNVSSGSDIFLWDFGDGSMQDTAINPVHQYSDTGLFKATLIASDGNCSDTAFRWITVMEDDKPGIKETIDQSGIAIIQSGVILNIYFNFRHPQQTGLTIIDATGRTILSEILPSVLSGKKAIPLKEFPEGVYLLQLSVEDRIIAYRFVRGY